MMKLILLAVAFIALVQPSIQLKCYQCKSENIASAYPDFNDPKLQICEGDKSKWPTTQASDLSLERCKKIVEKVKVNNKEQSLIIRTTGIENMGLDKNAFEEYSCKEDLCNSAVTIYSTSFAVVLSIIVTLTAYH